MEMESLCKPSKFIWGSAAVLLHQPFLRGGPIERTPNPITSYCPYVVLVYPPTYERGPPTTSTITHRRPYRGFFLKHPETLKP